MFHKSGHVIPGSHLLFIKSTMITPIFIKHRQPTVSTQSEWANLASLLEERLLHRLEDEDGITKLADMPPCTEAELIKAFDEKHSKVFFTQAPNLAEIAKRLSKEMKLSFHTRQIIKPYSRAHQIIDHLLQKIIWETHHNTQNTYYSKCFGGFLPSFSSRYWIQTRIQRATIGNTCLQGHLCTSSDKAQTTSRRHQARVGSGTKFKMPALHEPIARGSV